MATTIYEPTLTRSEAGRLIKYRVSELYDSSSEQSGRLRRVALDNLTVHFLHLGSLGVHFRVHGRFGVLLQGRLDPGCPGQYADGRLGITRWVRGRWEESFGVPMDCYDPHWNDRIPPALKKAIRKAASLPAGSEAAKQVIDLMIMYADCNSEDVIELTISGDEYAGDHACWCVNAMTGPSMAAVVPVMMWLNGAPPSDVLKAYKEAHDKQGVRRRHVRAVLGSSQRVADFLAFVTGADQLERVIGFLRAAPASEVTKLLAALAQRSDPVVDEIFPGGVAAFLQQFLINPSLTVRWVLLRKRSGLFS